MLILLPPSEGKNQADGSEKLSLERLLFPSELRALRTEAINTYNPSLFDEVASPAIEVYSGVLYQALDWHSLSESAKKRANDQVIIISALYGVLAPLDPIVSYSAKIRTSTWKSELTRILDAITTDLIVDCRSSTYAGVWQPAPQKRVAVRVFQEKNGKRSVITHMSKKYRGELTKLLLETRAPKTPDELLAVASKKYEAQLQPASATEPWYLDLIIKEVSSL